MRSVPLMQLITVHRNFVGSNNAEKVVGLKEGIHSFCSKNVGTAPFLVFKPRLFLDALVMLSGICPHQISNKTVCRWLTLSIKSVNLTNISQLRRDSAVNGKNLASDQGTQGQHIKGITKQVINLRIKLGFYLHFKIEGFCHMSRLMIPSQHRNLLRIVDLQCVEQTRCLNSKATSINVISKKDVTKSRIKIGASCVNLGLL